jgi:hypothetical protein
MKSVVFLITVAFVSGDLINLLLPCILSDTIPIVDFRSSKSVGNSFNILMPVCICYKATHYLLQQYEGCNYLWSIHLISVGHDIHSCYGIICKWNTCNLFPLWQTGSLNIQEHISVTLYVGSMVIHIHGRHFLWISVSSWLEMKFFDLQGLYRVLCVGIIQSHLFDIKFKLDNVGYLVLYCRYIFFDLLIQVGSSYCRDNVYRENQLLARKSTVLGTSTGI